MKASQFLAQFGRRLGRPIRRMTRSRRGTVIIIVLALLGMLAFLGFFVLGITSESNQSATYFANSPTAKNLNPAFDANAFFNDILRQIIIGPSVSEKQSVLWGGTNSLLPTMFGRDMAAYNGQGINLIWNGATNLPAIDRNYDNAPDVVTAGQPNLLQLNYSPGAQPTLVNFNTFSTDVPVYPDPDTNTTYPDRNSPFLSYDALIPNGTNPPLRVIIPSFHRPQLLRNLAPPATWYTAAATAPYVLHPHVQHMAISSSGTITTTQRFVSNTVPDTSGIGTPMTAYSIPGDGATPVPQEGIWSLTPPFNPAAPPTIAYDVDVDQDGVFDAFYMDFGFPLMQDSSGNQFVALGAVKVIETDSLFNLNVHGNRSALTAVPVPSNFGGNGMISLSDQGVSASELNPLWALNARPVAGSPDFNGSAAALSAALQQYTLFFRPSGAGANPANNFDATAGPLSFELANMDWWNALNGRPQLSPGTPPTVSGSSLPGRWGENTTRLDPNVAAVLSGGVIQAGIGSLSGDSFPLPGQSTVDDNHNQLEGGIYPDSIVSNISYPAFVHPVDFFAAGSWVTNVQGKKRLTYPAAATGTLAGSEQFPQYSQFWVNGAPSPWQPLTPYNVGAVVLPTTFNGFVYTCLTAGTSGGAPPSWPTPAGATVNDGTVVWVAILPTEWSQFLNGVLAINGGGKTLVDDTEETWTEPAQVAQQPSDNTFGPGENSVQMSGPDFTALGNPARTANLMSFNFAASTRAAEIRKRFTSTSWDLKSFGKEFFGADTTGGVGPYDARRLWEFTDLKVNGVGTGPFRFPPDFGTATAPNAYSNQAASQYPLRYAVASLLQVLANPNQLQFSSATSVTNTNFILPQRPLSVNGLTEISQSGTDSAGNPTYLFRFRPLTPHPSALNSNFANTAITPFPPASLSTSIPQVSFVTQPEQLLPLAANLQQLMPAQEWLARYDRQRLARDIYTLLYLMGGGADTQNQGANPPYTIPNYVTASNQPVAGVRPLYTDDQLKEMAQFAVNMVDALDPDSNITLFEYDKDLSNGWNLDDNAYDGTADAAAPYGISLADRGVVYGVERQQLALNEALVTFSQPCINTAIISHPPQDHPDTQWDDTKWWDFFYLELENVGPSPVSFLNEGWQIAVKQSPIVAAPPNAFYGSAPTYSGEMRLIFTSTQPTVPAGLNSKMTIGGMFGSSNGSSFTLTNGGGTPNPSYMVVDPNDTTGTPSNSGFDAQFPIAPRSAYSSPLAPPFANTTALNLDLAATAQTSNYWVVAPAPTAASQTADGMPQPNSPAAAGSQLLQFNDGLSQILPQSGTLVLRVELRRRADLNRMAILPTDTNNAAEAADNPWIVVDYMDVPVSVLALHITGNATDFSTQVQYQLGNLAVPPVAAGAVYNLYANPGGNVPVVSTERSQPLYHDYKLNPFSPLSNPGSPNGPFLPASATQYPRNGGASTLVASRWQGNSLGQDNDAAGFNANVGNPILPHPLYQPHNDRDFTSLGELLNIPLHGPYVPSYTTPDTMINPLTTSNSVTLTSGLTHLMAARFNEQGSPTGIPGPGNYTPELLVGADYVPTDPGQLPKHYVGCGTAGFRIQHPEGSDQTQANPATDFTENRWFRALGMLEVPTRSHRGLDPILPSNQINAGAIGGSPGFYRTPGKININGLRYPDIVAGMVGETDIFNMQFTPALTIPNYPNYSIPYLLQDLTGDTVPNAPPQNPVVAGAAVRDWWEQFIATRDGVDPLPAGLGGTGLSLPGLPRSVAGVAPTNPGSPPPGSHPFHQLGFSAYGGVDANGYNGPLESNLLRTLPGDNVTPPTPAPTFDLRRRLFELGSTNEHTSSAIDYSVKHRLLSRMVGNTTTRSNVFLVWIQVDFFQAKDVLPPNGVVRIGAKLGTGGVPGSSPGYRGFFVVDRSQALALMNQQYLPTTTAGQPFIFSFNQSFNYQSLILNRQRIQ